MARHGNQPNQSRHRQLSAGNGFNELENETTETIGHRFSDRLLRYVKVVGASCLNQTFGSGMVPHLQSTTHPKIQMRQGFYRRFLT